MLKALTEAESANFDTLSRVFANGDHALVRARLVENIEMGTEIAVIVAIVPDEDGVEMIPFGMLIPGDPYEMIEKPLDE